MRPFRLLSGIFTIITVSLILIFDIVVIVIGGKGGYYGGEILFTILTMLISLLVYITSILCIFLSGKKRALIFPAMMINISMALTITLTTVQYAMYTNTVILIIYAVILVFAAIPAMVFTIVYNAKVRPFARCCEGEEPKHEPVRVSRPSSSGNAFEEVRQAKQLLDMGAITQEEFDRIKERLL